MDGLAHKDQERLVQALMSNSTVRRGLEPDRSQATSPSDRARTALSFFVNRHIELIKPTLHEDGTIIFEYTAMVQIAYVHVARIVGEMSRIDRCEECGAPFRKTHGLQRFCPPGPFDSESRCSYRRRYKRFKSKEVKS